MRGVRRDIKEEFWLRLNQSIGNLGYFSIAWTFLLSAILLVTQIWLYWDGINFGHHPDCNEMINFYIPVDMYARKWHYFLRASSVLAASTLLPATVLGVVLYFTLGCWVELKKLNASKPQAESDAFSFVEAQWQARVLALDVFHGLTRNFFLDLVQLYKGISSVFRRFWKIPPGWRMEPIWRILSSRKSDLGYTILFLITLLPTSFSPTILYTLVGLFALVSGIIWTEGTIRVNNIDLSGATISSSGQLISLIVTIFTSIPILWTIFLAFFTGGNPKPAENQQHVNTPAEEPTNETDLRHQERENQTVSPVMAGHLGIDAGTIV